MISDETYLISAFRVNRHQFQHFENMFDRHGMTSDEIAAFKQIFAYCYCVLADNRLYCPMTKEFRRKHFHGVSLDRLCDDKDGPLKICRHPLVKNNPTWSYSLCQKYKPHPTVSADFERLMSADDEVLNWMTGRRVFKPTMSRIWTFSGHRLPSPVIDAMEVHNSIPKLYHHGAVEQKIAEMKADGSIDRAVRGERFLHNVELQLVSDFSRTPSPLCELVENEGFRAYVCRYEVKESGRVYEVHSGTQNIPRELKRVAFDHPEIRNYDIVSSHPMILRQLMEDYNAAFPRKAIDLSWLVDYTNGKHDKHFYADKVGISVDCWKTCLYAFFNAANIRKRNKPRGATDGLPAWHPARLYDSFSIFDAIEESLEDEFPDEGTRLAEAQNRFSNFKAALSGFDATMGQFLKALAGHVLSDGSFSPDLLKVHRYKKSRSISNACGMRKKVLGPGGKPVRHSGNSVVGPKHLLSFLLQGAEAALVHRLTALGDKYGYYPLGNEHDGLIVLGEIPPAAIDEAIAATGLKYTRLVEKGF